MKIFSILFFFLVIFIVGYLFVKIIKFLFPVLLLLFVVYIISSLLKGKPAPPKSHAYHKEEIKDVEIRVVDEPTAEKSKENRI
jgi:Ca2+/Na+ antiporter